MGEPEEKAVTAEQRVRLYRELLRGGNVGGELVYDSRFYTEHWPRTVYALTNTDLDEVLDELDRAREKLLENDESALLRQDLEDLQNQIEDLKTERDGLYRTVKSVGDEVSSAVEDVRERLEAFLTEGVRLGHGLVHRTALDLLRGLPGIPEPQVREG